MDVLVEVDEVLVESNSVDVVKLEDHDEDDVEDDVVLGVVDVKDVVEVLVVVVSHPLQVLAQCVMFATRLSHKPCNRRASH